MGDDPLQGHARKELFCIDTLQNLFPCPPMCSKSIGHTTCRKTQFTMCKRIMSSFFIEIPLTFVNFVSWIMMLFVDPLALLFSVGEIMLFSLLLKLHLSTFNWSPPVEDKDTRPTFVKSIYDIFNCKALDTITNANILIFPPAIIRALCFVHEEMLIFRYTGIDLFNRCSPITFTAAPLRTRLIAWDRYRQGLMDDPQISLYVPFKELT